ncbi:hypothetical protein [Streptomyces sp. NPDC093111]|uniref:hypothetical protein n=1 Tax=Streptomyces sp. NPDC093111 TaxID=3154978 RepID=UPI003434BF75
MNHADTTAPIYSELIREQGDVPGDVRRTAEEVLRDLSRVIQMPPAGMPPAGMAPAGMAPTGMAPAGMAPSRAPMQQPMQQLPPGVQQLPPGMPQLPQGVQQPMQHPMQ